MREGSLAVAEGKPCSPGIQLSRVVQANVTAINAKARLMHRPAPRRNVMKCNERNATGQFTSGES